MHKRAAAPGPERETLDQARQNEQFHKQVAVDARTQCRAVMSENALLRSQLNHALSTAQDQQEEVAQLSAMIEQGRILIEQMGANEGHFQSQITRGQEQLASLMDRATSAQTQMTEALAEVVRLQATVHARDDVVNRLNAQIHEREDEMESLRLQMRQNDRVQTPAGQPKRRAGRVSREFFQPARPSLVELAMDPAPVSSPSSPTAPPDPIKKLAAELDMDADLLIKFAQAMNMVNNTTAHINVNAGKSTPRYKASQKSEAKAAVAPETQELVNKARALMCKMIYEKFGVQQASDFIFHVPATEEEVEVFAQDNEAAIQRYQWDFSLDYKSSAWNAAVMERLVAEVVRKDSLNMRYIEKGLISAEYLGHIVEELLVRYRGDWKEFKPKWDIERDRMETTAEAIARGKLTLFACRVLSRTINAQHMESDGAEDIATWKRLLEILNLLGAAGMSEEEESSRSNRGTKTRMYVVKLDIWWEPLVANYMDIINKHTNYFQALHNGTKAAPCQRVEQAGTGKPLKGLPECLYKSGWLASLSSMELKELKVSKQAFALFVAATNRMAR
ncbi:unnamed protein product [Mycena citricolor]|uniref:Uncharacterized protein n=1 Tax=Mycena citricolor TaxID=2018698 RepID=A0AAD2HJ28_9AGAR|nr:unnamed protein product [Mycena citricolor]